MSETPARLDAGISSPKTDASLPAADAGITPIASGAVIYQTGRIHSVLTSSMVTKWQALLSRNTMNSDRSFIKVGDSITVSNQFMKCFESDNLDLDQFSPLAPTVTHFRSASSEQESPYLRESEAAEVGRTAQWVLSGSPSPLEREMVAMNPSYGVVMFGTNDVGILSRVDFADAMMQVVQNLMSQGILPILNTVPPRPSSQTADQNTKIFNEIIRGIAQAREIPLIDFNLSLAGLPEFGLAGDAIHPSTYRTNAGLRACTFSENGLKYGYNQRNLRTLEALHRLRSAIFVGETDFLESDIPRIEGAGTSTAPVMITSLPFSDLRNTTESSS
ncbi:MAG: SGNH/GDSL hydrolase family protein, partial [Myxococcota bacterium]|nr:SGNH/GDSL hydrolase family protein [Myxococcota bacterium]